MSIVVVRWIWMNMYYVFYIPVALLLFSEYLHQVHFFDMFVDFLIAVGEVTYVELFSDADGKSKVSFI